MAELRLIPQVAEWSPYGEKTRTVTLPVSYMGECDEDDLFPLEKDRKGEAVLLIMEGEDIPEEGYELEIREDGMVIHYGDLLGRYYALVTLFELVRIYEGQIPCGHISDAPRYEYRGFMLDESRHFFGMEEVKKILDEMAAMKLNEFHWHLSDDQGYRIESRKYPKLNEVASRRMEADGTESSGYYTFEQIEEIVEYADRRCIEVIPEIDLPGHTSAFIAAYPALSCTGKPEEVKNHGGIYPRILCPGKDQVLTFLYGLLDEVVPLFPGRYFHIGGDEAPKSEWKQCPDCQARMKAEGLENEEALQGWLTDKLIAYLDSKDKVVIGWNEMLSAGPKTDAVAQYWNEFGPSKMEEPIRDGQCFIFSDNPAAYCDYPYGMVSLIGTYSYGGRIGEWDVPEDQGLGLECALWSEHVADTGRLERQIFPRIQALGENGWSVRKDFESWKNRMKEREAWLKTKGLTFTTVEEADIRGEAGIPRALQSMQEFAALMTGGGNGAPTPPADLPPEMQEQIAASLKGFLGRFFAYAFTPEQVEQILTAVMTAMAKGRA